VQSLKSIGTSFLIALTLTLALVIDVLFGAMEIIVGIIGYAAMILIVGLCFIGFTNVIYKLFLAGLK
jgi:hypothetical protein